jgi:hypothetical protein
MERAVACQAATSEAQRRNGEAQGNEIEGKKLVLSRIRRND